MLCITCNTEPLCAAEDRSQTSGAVGRALFEHVDAQRIVRVAQPRCLQAIEGTPPDWQQTGGAVNRGHLFLGYFLLATQKKVTSSRSATGKCILMYPLQIT